MKKKSLFISLAVLGCAAIVGTSITFAAWFSNRASENNTITVGNPIEIEVTGKVADNTALMPGGTVATTFTVALTSPEAGKTYKAAITAATFKDASNADLGFTYTDSDAATVAVWQYKIGEGSYTDLTASGGAAASAVVSDADTVVITVKLDGGADLPVTLAGGVLKFTVALIEAA
ncbi:MAG: hypothetical protein LBH24_05700 [Clostridiales bacterium]|jgi:hypothetical protein|nr:hypothetical protein [Clostridiales bacterium]